LSLTDCVSFAVIRRLGLRKVFCFDRHFQEQGIEIV
jgi:predicted nucleic acid-binding protein